MVVLAQHPATPKQKLRNTALMCLRTVIILMKRLDVFILYVCVCKSCDNMTLAEFNVCRLCYCAKSSSKTP